jgi:hypothetical protein
MPTLQLRLEEFLKSSKIALASGKSPCVRLRKSTMSSAYIETLQGMCLCVGGGAVVTAVTGICFTEE